MRVQEVASVKVPGESGEYGITAGHTPLISPMKPGVFQIFHDAVSAHLYLSTH
jgi:F0F1-type ATP synthase epsilon subunit